MDEITYLHLGKRDLKEAEGVLSLGYYSTAGRLVQQAVEKHLKQYIQDNGETGDIKILTTHNTISLYERVINLGGLEFDKESHKMMFVLRSYYYDTNYPGANSRELNKEEATDAVDFAKKLISAIKFNHKGDDENGPEN